MAGPERPAIVVFKDEKRCLYVTAWIRPATAGSCCLYCPGLSFACERVLANTDQLTDILEMNAATLKALGLATDAIDAVMAWQADDAGHPVLVEADRIRSACRASGIFLIGYAEAGYPDAL